MRKFNKFAVIPLLGIALLGSPVAFSQGPHGDRHDNHHDNHGYVHHKEWRKGYRMPQSDWGRGQRISDYRRYHLRRPPRGYEWRQVDGNYVLAAVATGVIASVIAAAAAQ